MIIKEETMKQNYEKPEMEIIDLYAEDVICTSCTTFTPEDNEGPLNPDF